MKVRSTPAQAGLLLLLGLMGPAAALAAPAGSADPKVPAAIEPGNRVPVAILTAGFDYTRPAIASRLARDGEGEIVAWDIPGNDRLPFDPAGDTDLFEALAAGIDPTAPVSLLPVKVDAADPVSLAKGLAFVARTAARIVIVPMWSHEKADWEVFAKAAAHFPNLRLIVRTCPDLAPGNGASVFPRDLGLAGAAVPEPPDGDPAAPLTRYVALLPCRFR